MDFYLKKCLDIVNAKIGNIKEAYDFFKLKISNIDNNDIYAISNAILETVDEFFGGITNIESRMNYYYPDDLEGSKNNAIPNLINGQVSPLIAEIDKESFKLLSSPISNFGISVTVSHYNPYRNYDVTITYDSNREKHIEVDPLTSKELKQL